MAEPTNEKLAEDIAEIRGALGRKAEKSTVEGLLKRSDVRPKALVDGPEDAAAPGGPAGSDDASASPGESDQQDLTTQQELQEATASSTWTGIKPAELVGLAVAWQALKLEIPTLFNLEIFTEKLLGNINLFPNAEGRGFHIARNEYGFLLPTRRPAATDDPGDGQTPPADPTRPGTQPTPTTPATPARPATPTTPARPTPRPARGRATPTPAAGADPEQQRRLQASLRRTNDESRRAASGLRDASGAAATLASAV